jgi:hypothetical protein
MVSRPVPSASDTEVNVQAFINTFLAAALTAAIAVAAAAVFLACREAGQRPAATTGPPVSPLLNAFDQRQREIDGATEQLKGGVASPAAATGAAVPRRLPPREAPVD